MKNDWMELLLRQTKHTRSLYKGHNIVLPHYYIYNTSTHMRLLIWSILTFFISVTIWRFRNTLYSIFTLYITFWTRHCYNNQIEAGVIKHFWIRNQTNVLPKSTVSSLMLFSICVLYCCKYFGPSEKMLLITVFCMSAKRKYLNIVLLVSWVCVALLFIIFMLSYYVSLRS